MGPLRIAHRLADLPPYVPGRRPDGGAKQPARLASNEVPWPPSGAIVAAMERALRDVNRYPDAQYAELREAIAWHVGRPAGSVAVANGSTALLRDLVTALVEADSEVVFAEPSFPYYRGTAIAAAAVPVPVPLADHAHDFCAMLDAITEHTRVVIICNPNNPTGSAYANEELESFVSRVPRDVAVVLDEAYVEFAKGVDGTQLLDRFPNVVVVRTLSKAHGLAGLRIGYAIGDEAVIEAVSRLGVPFRIDAVAAAGALAALQPVQIAESERRVTSIIEERNLLLESLRSRGWPVAESSANFLFLPVGDAAAEVARVCASNGVLVRAIGGGIRVTIGSRDDCEQFLKALPALPDHLC